MDGQTRRSVELLVANVTLEVLGLLVINEYLVIIKFSVAIPRYSRVKEMYRFYIMPITSNVSRCRVRGSTVNLRGIASY